MLRLVPVVTTGSPIKTRLNSQAAFPVLIADASRDWHCDGRDVRHSTVQRGENSPDEVIRMAYPHSQAVMLASADHRIGHSG
jgi:hypothetical protein